MNAIGSLIGAGGNSLHFIMSHIIAISLTIVVVIIGYKGYRYLASRPKVRVRYERD